MIPAAWVPHRRPADDELVGYLEPVADGGEVIPRTLFGYPLNGPLPIRSARRSLNKRGLPALSALWLLDDGGPQLLKVVLVDVTPQVLRVRIEDVASQRSGEVLTFDVPVREGLLAPV